MFCHSAQFQLSFSRQATVDQHTVKRYVHRNKHNHHLIPLTVLNIPITNPAVCVQRARFSLVQTTSATVPGVITSETLVGLPNYFLGIGRPTKAPRAYSTARPVQHPCCYFILFYYSRHVQGGDSACLLGSAKQLESVRAGVQRPSPHSQGFRQGCRVHLAYRSIPAS